AEEFIYNRGFLDANLQLDGSANIRSNGLLQLTNTSGLLNGRAFYPSPINFNNRSSSAESLSFSTNFVITIVPRLKDSGGHGIAFVISHTTDFSHAAAIQYLGLFDTIFSLDIEDLDSNHVGIDLNGVKLNQSVASAYFSNEERKNISLELNSGHLIQYKFVDPPTIWCDNTSVIAVASNPILHSKFKHVELDLFFVREKVAEGSLIVGEVPVYDQIADILTKPLSTSHFCRHRQLLRVSPLGPAIKEVMQYLKGNASLLDIPLDSAPNIMPSSILETFQVRDQTTEISLSVADNSGSDSIILFYSSAGKGLSLNSLSSADTVLRTGR
ncbi:hypothetical protein Goklo_025169, partial [Gossypium klotzschianum]|nr:hypothetical protein [Gossypium klotzschianum]